ncbi:hypothetical protein [Streptomyces cylindrosporus]|uniref:Uncharacterized protein n=1 Tax=Streptomyces cylindrosporus TaxID=2927583 RepID=A0ABS9YKA6_9ACTN|nr:hypothetical protein [Streptomyces cylindrosporus]MCI3277624.1 hypothetical protein [Streptomyces cylindrosporus]
MPPTIHLILNSLVWILLAVTLGLLLVAQRRGGVALAVMCSLAAVGFHALDTGRPL